MATQGAIAFWSYVRDDDRAEDGRIGQLAEDLKARYELLTGEEIEIFVDGVAIRWGQDWRGRIREALGGTTFFIAVITPRYFQSRECRRELIAFATEASQLGVTTLLLSVLYVDVPELDDPSTLTDEAMILVARHQHEDWRELRLEDRSSPAYRRGVENMAKRLAEVVEELTAIPPVPVAVSDLLTDDDTPGVIETNAAAEQAMGELLAATEELGPQLAAITDIASKMGEEMDALSRNPNASAALALTIRMAEEMRQSAEEIQRLGQRNAAALINFEPAIRGLLDAAAADMESARADRDVVDMLRSISEMAAASREGTEGLRTLSASLDDTARVSRAFRPVARSIQRGLRGFVDAQDIYDDWDRRIAALGLLASDGTDLEGEPDG